MGSGFSIKARGRREADILIYEDVGEGWFGGVTAKQFSEDLAAVGSVDVLNLRISSLGGDVNTGLAIYRRLVDHPARVITHIDGWAASIASVIAMAGNEIRIAEAGAVMIHNAWGAAAGDADAFRSMADRLDANTAAIADVYVSRTPNGIEKVRDWMRSETWFYGQEAVDAGFAETVVANLKVAARYDPSRHVFRNAPATLGERPNASAFRQRLAQMQATLTRSRV